MSRQLELAIADMEAQEEKAEQRQEILNETKPTVVAEEEKNYPEKEKKTLISQSIFAVLNFIPKTKKQPNKMRLFHSPLLQEVGVRW